MVDVRVTRQANEILESVPGSVRVTRVQTQTQLGLATNPIRVTRVQAQVHMDNKVNAIRVTHFATQVLRSVSSLPPVQPTRTESVGQREANPFKPTLPRELSRVNDPDASTLMPMMTEYMGDQAQLIRQQHNITQAGDSTVPWEFLSKIGPQRLYTLGSLGRFYHDDFGIIIARYCQFSKIKAPEWLNGPCGRLNQSNSVDWKVTNDFDLSSADNVVGFIASYTAPEEGDYGWIIVEGANTVPILTSQLVNTVNDQDWLVWSSFERVRNTGNGRVIGRVIGQLNIVNKAQHQFDAGGVYISLEGPSIDSITEAVAGDLDSIREELEAAVAEFESLQAQGLPSLIATLQKQVSILQTQMVSEVGTRSAQVTAINATIAEIQALLATRASQIEVDEIQQGQIIQNQQIATALQQANTALGQIQTIIAADFGAQIQVLSGLIANISTTKLVPVVDGSIPPNLVYLPDGQLIFAEISL